MGLYTSLLQSGDQLNITYIKPTGLRTINQSHSIYASAVNKCVSEGEITLDYGDRHQYLKTVVSFSYRSLILSSPYYFVVFTNVIIFIFLDCSWLSPQYTA